MESAMNVESGMGASGIKAGGPGAASSPAWVRVALEVGPHRTFATALDWPGWCRAGKGETAAVDCLLDYLGRYQLALAATGLTVPIQPEVEVVERLKGGAGTDFGAPGVPAADESRPTSAADGLRLGSMLEAFWSAFDEIADAAPEALRKGPRGGGRDRSRIVEHVIEAERSAYARKLGVRHPPFAPDDLTRRNALRADILAVLRRPSDGGPVIERGWTVRFAVRYMSWHVLDHAWEIEDRAS
jgi:hypothetical protein